MTTKESAMALIAVIALIVSAQFAFAQTDSINTVDANIDNLEGDAGAFAVGWNQVQTFFTFNQEKKAELELQLAKLRLIQAKIAAEKNDTEAMQRALEAHDRIIEKVQSRIDKIDGADKPDKIKASYGSLVRLQKSIEVHESRIEKLKDILADTNLSEEQRLRVENKLLQVENNTAKLNELQLRKEEQVKTKLRAMSNMSEEEIESEVELLESSEGLVEAQRLVAQKRIESTEQAIAKIKERLSVERQNGINTSIVEDQIAVAEQLLSQARELYDAGNYSGAISTIKPVSNFGRNMKEIVHQIKEARQEQRQERVKELVQEAQAEGATVREGVKEKGDGQLVGNDRDEHGCIGSAGYSWCEAKQKCLRIWEENCSEEQSGIAFSQGNGAMAGRQ